MSKENIHIRYIVKRKEKDKSRSDSIRSRPKRETEYSKLCKTDLHSLPAFLEFS